MHQRKMFEHVDLGKRIDEKEYDKVAPEMKNRLGELQRKARDVGMPIIVVFEGWDTVGMGELVNKFILPLDPRGFLVHPISAPNAEESSKPFLWRFFVRIPARGRIAVFDRSWYFRSLARTENGQKVGARQVWREISEFEEMLSQDDYLIMKFFLHISKKEHKRRLEKYHSSDLDRCAISDPELDFFKKYDKMLPAIEEMIERTDREYAPWTIVEAEDNKFATAKILTTTVRMIEYGLSKLEAKNLLMLDSNPLIKGGQMFNSTRGGADLGKSLSQDEYRDKLKKLQCRVGELQCELNINKIPSIVVFEGWDAAGKGGAIQRLTAELNPRGYEVVPVGSPTLEEKAHHYLWRFYLKLPPAGHIRIFDRSWYGRVLVERVEGLCSTEEWKRAYQEINEFEGMLVENGTVLIKIWLEIDQQTQLQRFQEREKDRSKQWKISEEDWRNREKWDFYGRAVDEMLFRTSTNHAPWTVVESNDKYYSRVKTLQTIVQAMESKFLKAKDSK
ncbi:MAG: polyphosphate:AMP phosphotransferase [Methanomassiliicoccales archaeon]|nr:polyphosphate:AMP phosphotransferase [Methanomassiliicoccales archaeon]